MFNRLLIAESRRTVKLRHFCSRLLGWNVEHIDAIDQALRSIRLARSGKVALVLYGRGDMVSIAFAIHRYAFGGESPFVVSDPRRHNMSATVRSPANCRNGMAAFRKALGGSLCVRAERLPQDFGNVLRAFRDPVGSTSCSSAQAIQYVKNFSWGALRSIFHHLRHDVTSCHVSSANMQGMRSMPFVHVGNA